MFFLDVLAGFFVGLLVGMTGVGGGALMTPLLVLLFGVAPHTAVGTDLIFATLTKTFGVWLQRAEGRIDWVIVRRLAIGSLPGAVLTLGWISMFETPSDFRRLITGALSLALIITSIALIFKPHLIELGKRFNTSSVVHFKRLQIPLTIFGGLTLGVLVTLTSVGAGALGAVVLLYLYPFRLTTRNTVGTDLAHAIPLAFVAGLGHLALGHVDFGLVGLLLAGSLPGIYLGVRLAGKAPDMLLRYSIALVLATMGVKMVL